MFSKCLKLHLKLWVKENVLPPLFSRPSLPFLGQALEMFHKVLFATLTFLFNLKLSFLWPKCVNWPFNVPVFAAPQYFDSNTVSVHLQTSFISGTLRFVLLRRRRSWLFYAFSFILKFVYCLLAGHLWCTHSAILCLFSTLSATTVLVSCGEICFAGFRSAIFG